MAWTSIILDMHVHRIFRKGMQRLLFFGNTQSAKEKSESLIIDNFMALAHQRYICSVLLESTSQSQKCSIAKFHF